MKNKKRNFSIGLIMAATGVILLGVDKVFVSANSNTSFTQSFTTLTIIALVILLAAGTWLYWISFK